MVDQIIRNFSHLRTFSGQPQNWTHKPNFNSKAELIEGRKAADRVDPSYDIDGDGHVSQKDYFIAKHFDLDKDGKLDAKESQSAAQAVAEGFEKNFLFGLERAGLNDNMRVPNKVNWVRVLQKKGKILSGEDFTPLVDVAERPKTAKQRPSTQQELFENRRKKSVFELEKAFGSTKEKVTEFVEQLPKRSQSALRKGSVEVTAKLGQEITKELSLNYVSQPVIPTQTILTQKRVQIDREECSGKDAIGYQKNLNKRQNLDILQRQNVVPEPVQEVAEGKPVTYMQIKNQLRKDEKNYNTLTFGKVEKDGIHIQKQPTFKRSRHSEFSVDWWKARGAENYNANPTFISQRQMLAQKKFWAKQDELFLNEMSGKEAPIDPFKNNRVIVPKNEILANKIVDNVVNMKENPTSKQVTQQKRFSELYGPYQDLKNQRVFDRLVPLSNLHSDFDPVFSSFQNNKVAIVTKPPRAPKPETKEIKDFISQKTVPHVKTNSDQNPVSSAPPSAHLPASAHSTKIGVTINQIAEPESKMSLFNRFSSNARAASVALNNSKSTQNSSQETTNEIPSQVPHRIDRCLSSAKQQLNVGVRTAGFISCSSITVAPTPETKKVLISRPGTSVAMPRPNTEIRGRTYSSLTKISSVKV